MGELFVIEPQQMQGPRLKVMDMHGILDTVEANVVGLANNLAASQAAAGHPQAVGVR